jgi:hypothetical protein
MSSRPRETEGEVSWSNTLLGAATLAACLPALFGCLGTFVPEILSPGPMMPMETASERLLVSIYTRSMPLAMMSLPATLVGLLLGLWTMRRAGPKTAFGKIIGSVLIVTILLSVAFAIKIVLILKSAGRF